MRTWRQGQKGDRELGITGTRRKDVGGRAYKRRAYMYV